METLTQAYDWLAGQPVFVQIIGAAVIIWAAVAAVGLVLVMAEAIDRKG